MKGGGGGASSQRGTALINWIRAVLMTHSGHLMTVSSRRVAPSYISLTSSRQMPDLVARLSGLHATLTQRLTLQESLLSLSGRLDMVISQIEMRSSGPPAPLPLPKAKSKQKPAKAREATRYVEGESEEEDAQAEVQVESADEDGSVEDVELGGEDSEEESLGSDEDDEEDDDEDDEGDDSAFGGFIDDEAEEYSEDEDEDESE